MLAVLLVLIQFIILFAIVVLLAPEFTATAHHCSAANAGEEQSKHCQPADYKNVDFDKAATSDLVALCVFCGIQRCLPLLWGVIVLVIDAFKPAS